MITIYGIPNCDTIKRARDWFLTEDIAYRFHDYRKDGADQAMIKSFVRDLGLDGVLNRRGTTWRRLAEAEKTGLDDAKAIRLMANHPALIKRPVIEVGSGDNIQRFVGFTDDVKRQLWAAVEKGRK